MRFPRITVDAGQMGGVPCIRGLRIPVATVVSMVVDGLSEAEILAAFPDLEGEDIREALRYVDLSGRDTLLEKLQGALPTLKERYPIKSLGLFGSFARGDMSEASDLDVLVEFARPVSLSRFLALEDELRQLTGREVDLVSRESLKPYMGRNVLRDLVPV